MRSLGLTEDDWEAVSSGKNLLEGVRHFKDVHYSLFRGGLSEETVGAGLDQLDVLTDKLVRHRASSVDKAELPSRKPSEGISLVDAALVLICGALGNAALEGPSWRHLVCFLVLLAVLLLGTNNVGPISRDLVKRKGTVLRRVPLTDKTFTIKTLPY